MTIDLKKSSLVLNMRSKKNDVLITKSIGESLFPKTKRQLLTLFFLAKERRHYFREITRIVKASPGAVQRELKSLTEAGILVSEKIGNQKYYWADPECMIYQELRIIVVKTFGVVETVLTALEEIRSDITVAFIYGSIAQGKDTGRSDIDLMVVGKAGFRILTKALGNVEEILSRPINPTLFSIDEFKTKLRNKNNFVSNIVNSKKLFIIGNQDDFTKLVQ